MTATLYSPYQSCQQVSSGGLHIADPETGFVQVPERVAALLGCTLELVDVLASGPGYVVYSVFDSEGQENHAAMAVVAEVSGVEFDLGDEDTVLYGPVLVVRQ